MQGMAVDWGTVIGLRDDHALREWHLVYVNHSGATDRIQVV
jgi:hypothetical protein